ncbi:DUF305 domain-containing protein (plasmid) [Deinococcus taeanensis]|uniref:DUF305 domain-containing protein n=1 Tax=Deinococcus taeanensis TaxID=2737050 RepID=UPI001CDC541F|nr:DUF305 domain-containing protein [Deinococcus taeanensis]UBV45309.1 DUF305 domain-containing protein [Deinococcus taeanensis]
MKTNFLLLAGLTALTSLTAPALAQMNHGAHSSAATTQNQGLPELSGPAFDRAYLSMMVAHHQGAITMSKAVQGRLQDAQVKAWAAGVIRDQTRELNVMSAWLKGMGGLNTAVHARMTSDMNGMVAPLKTARNPDQAFVQGMLPHHASALDMATLALQKSRDARVLKLSRDVIKAQADEMYAFKQWLAGRS